MGRDDLRQQKGRTPTAPCRTGDHERFMDQGMDPADEPPFALVEKFEDDTEIDWQRVERTSATISEENLIGCRDR